MRHETWLKLDSMPAWRRFYQLYRLLPDPVRAPFRWAAAPHWTIAAALVRSFSKNSVVAGPFKGMRIKLSPVSSRHHLGYILGTQELEVHPIIEKICATSYDEILNVGAADGYYAIGLARRCPKSEIIAFEALPNMHPVIRDAAADNGVNDRIEIFGKCEPTDFQQRITATRGRALVFMDIEGGEVGLLNLMLSPALSQADIFVETHDCYVPGCTEILIQRFSGTHTIEQISARTRTVDDFPKGFMAALPANFPSLATDLMDERRIGVQQWLFLKSKAIRS